MAWEGLFGGGSNIGIYDPNKSLFGKPIPPITGPDGMSPTNAYGVPLLNTNQNGGLYGQLEPAFLQDKANASNGGIAGFASELLFGDKPPQLPSSLSQAVLGGDLGDELGKAIKPLAIPLAIVAGIFLLSKGGKL